MTFHNDTTVNIPLLRKVVEWVEEQAELPEKKREWYQGDWFIKGQKLGLDCGTAMCIAGKVAQDDGWLLDFNASGYTVTKNGRSRRVEDVALQLLGLEPIAAGVLFNGVNTAADIRRIAEDLAGEPL